MTDFLEDEVLPQLSRLEKAVKKRDSWAYIIAQNTVQSSRVLEESNIMVRRIEQEISDTDATIKDTSNYPVSVIMKLSEQLGPKIQLHMLNKLIEI